MDDNCESISFSYNHETSVKEIYSEVKVGRSYKSKVWTLNKKDILKWLPFNKWEWYCKLEIDGILIDARVVFLPRLFFKSNNLEKHLKNLVSKDKSDLLLPLKIDISSANFIDPHECKNIDYIDLQLTVGKSFKSKVWLLPASFSEEMISSKSQGTFPIIVDRIPAIGTMHLRFRLFYNDKKLSEHLEELYIENPKQKVNARIIFNEDFYKYSKVHEELISTDIDNIFDAGDSSKDLNFEESYNHCLICGCELKENEIDKCFSCRDKNVAVKYLNDILPFISPYVNFSKKDLIYQGIFTEDIDVLLLKLLKYDLILEVSDNCFKLNDFKILNEFVKTYSDYGIGLDFVKDSNKISIFEKDLINDSNLESIIFWDIFDDIVKFIFRDNGKVTLIKLGGRFEEKVVCSSKNDAFKKAAYYLESLSFLRIISDDEVRLQFER